MEKRERKYVVILFFSSIIVYAMAASFFTTTVHIDVDEELYVALARSFHYQGRFEYGRELLNYSCVLYSMIISLAYYWYSPDSILFVMRLFGVVLMCSSVFPIFLLAKDILKESRKALIVTVFLMLMPYMLDSVYLMQEVLAYPLFLWTVFLSYKAFGGYKGRMDYALIILSAIFAGLCMFTKTYMFFIPIVVNGCMAFTSVQEKNIKKYIDRMIVYDVVYLIFFTGMYLMIFAINGFEQGSNHYATQFSHLFPITVNTIFWGFLGCLVYMALLIVNTGIYPWMSIVNDWKTNKSWLNNFLLGSCVFLILEIVFMVVLTEEGVGTLPHKFLFRYFQIFVPLIVILFVGQENFIRGAGILRMRVWAWGSLLTGMVYFLFMQGDTRQAIMDGHFFLLLENVSKIIVPYGDVLILAALAVLAELMIYLRKNNLERIQKFCVVMVCIFWGIQAVSLPYYTNVVAGGEELQNDSVQLAGYLNEEGYEYVYYVYSTEEEKNSYMRNFYGYIRQPYEVISCDEVQEVINNNPDKKIGFLYPQEGRFEENVLKKADIGETYQLALYVL